MSERENLRLTKEIRALSKSAVQPFAHSVDKDGRFPAEAIAALKGARLLSALVPKQLGGCEYTIENISEICTVLARDCSSTAMIYAMHQSQILCLMDHYGSSRFMKDYRLNGARRDLGRIVSQETKISDVANRWGFWHLGQFAKDYRLWFGELPSETYRRNQVENSSGGASMACAPSHCKGQMS